MKVPSKVLVVEDDPVLCDFIQEVLSSEEMEADGVTDSTQAAARLVSYAGLEVEDPLQNELSHEGR